MASALCVAIAREKIPGRGDGHVDVLHELKTVLAVLRTTIGTIAAWTLGGGAVVAHPSHMVESTAQLMKNEHMLSPSLSGERL